MMKINTKLLPIKAHYFFFLGAMGPIIPFLPIFGKHLGLSEVIVGSINAVIPVLFFGLKPVFGFILDYFQEKRKIVFMSILTVMTLSFFFLLFIPDSKIITEKEAVCSSIKYCDKSVYELWNAEAVCGNITHEIYNDEDSLCIKFNQSLDCTNNQSCSVVYYKMKNGFYTGFTFWSFVLAMSIGSVCMNICTSLTDAICFEILGKGNEMKYGRQRVWASFAFGLIALIGGYFMDYVGNTKLRSITDCYPAVYLCLLLMVIDLAICSRLKLPPIAKSENILLDVWSLIKKPHIATFITFAVFAGMGDVTIFFYLLWYLEDMAIESGSLENLRLLQGLTVAAQTLVGEVVSFSLSGRILSKLGYGHCLSLSFLLYALRFALIALIPSPWWILPIEIVMQGSSYALCYTTIVAYASAISPAGTNATIQGIAAGMDDGVGFILGNLLWSAIYKWYGGKAVFWSSSALALSCSIAHCILYNAFFKNLVEINNKPNNYIAGRTEEIDECEQREETEA